MIAISQERDLKAITFDLWGTLIIDTPAGSRWSREERIRGIAGILKGAGISTDPEAINRAYVIQGDRLERLWVTHMDVSIREQIELLLDILQDGLRARISESLIDGLVEAYTTPILSAMPVPIDSALEVLAVLSSRGLRLAVICNTGRTPGKILRIILQRLGMAPYLSAQTFSDELSLRKPHPEIFKRTLTALGVEPPEALHVGDTLATDFRGAQAIGMRAMYFDRLHCAKSTSGVSDTIFSLLELLRITKDK